MEMIFLQAYTVLETNVNYKIVPCLYTLIQKELMLLSFQLCSCAPMIYLIGNAAIRFFSVTVA